MENKSIFVSILLTIALISGYLYYDNKVEEIQEQHSSQTSKLLSDHSQQLANLNNSSSELTDSRDEIIKNLKNEIQDLLATNSSQKSNTESVNSSDLLSNFKSSLAELNDEIKQKNVLIDSFKLTADKAKNELLSCENIIQNTESCGNIGEIEMQLIDKNSQLIKAQKDLSLAKSNITVLKDEKVRANLAINKNKELTKSINELENTLKITQEDLNNSLRNQNKLENNTKENNETIQTLKNKLSIASKKLSNSESNYKLTSDNLSKANNEVLISNEKLLITKNKLSITKANFVKSTRQLLNLKNQLNNAKADLVLSDKKVTMMKNKLAGIKKTLTLYEKTVSAFKDTLSKQNKLIVSDSIDRIKATEQLYGVTFAVYLAGFTEDEVENYCLTIKETTDFEVEVFGKVTSLDEETQDEYRQLCSSVD